MSKKGLLLLNNGVEDVEALATRALLIRHGFEITTFSVENKIIKTAFNLEVHVDKLINEVIIEDYDFLILPGGAHVFNILGKYNNLNSLISGFNMDNKLIGAICAAPLLLNDLNLLVNKSFTSFPDVSNKIKGNYLAEAKVVRSGNIVTSRSAGTVYEFVFEIIKVLENEKSVANLMQNIVY